MREEEDELRTRLLNKRDAEFNNGNLQKHSLGEIKMCLSDSLIRQHGSGILMHPVGTRLKNKSSFSVTYFSSWCSHEPEKNPQLCYIFLVSWADIN